jgi:hypothetical protein
MTPERVDTFAEVTGTTTRSTSIPGARETPSGTSTNGYLIARCSPGSPSRCGT